jgi:hypothetical protein
MSIPFGKAEEGADGRKLPGQGATFHPAFAPPRHEAAEICGRKTCEFSSTCGLPQMIRQEPAEL